MNKNSLKNLFQTGVAAFLALTALDAPGAITFDAASAGTAGTGGAVSTVVWSHTVGDSGPDRMLVVGVAAERTSDAFPTSVTYGSQSLTKAVGSSANQSPVVAPINSTEIWYLAAPAVGTGTITVTFATSVPNGMECGAVSLFGVSNSAPEAVSVANGATSGTTYTNMITTLTAGAWLVDVANSGAGAAINTLTSTTAGLTRRWNGASGLQLVGAGGTREVLTPGTVTNTWVSTGSSRRAQSTAAFAPAPPSPVAVAITSPTNTAVVSTTSFSVNANATVNPGSVTNVDFYLDAALVGSDTSYPFSFVVSGASAGAHTLTAVATSGGISATSAVVNVTAANLAPTVAITSPANGSPVLAGASVPLTATATDDNTVTNVYFYVDGTLVSSDSSSPFTGTWASATLGAHTVTAVARDNGGLSTTSAVVNITGFASFSAYEPFSYPLGAFTNNTPSTATGFSGNWTVANTPSIVAGLTYPNLPTTTNAYQHGATASRTTVNFFAPMSSGTEYVSFLFKGPGGNGSGGDAVGVFLKGDNANSLFAGFRTPNSSTLTGFGLGSVSSTNLSGVTALGSAINIDHNNTNLIVLKIDFNTSGANDTVSLWINPPAGTNAPGVAANVIHSTFDVGNISGFGFNIQGGYVIKMDEFRRGSSYGEVVGVVVATPTIPTTVDLTPSVSKQVSWTAFSTNSYQPQESSDNSTWTDLGSLIVGSAVTTVSDATPVDFYRVLEFTPGGPGPDELLNGSFEITDVNNSGAANWGSSANTTFESVWATNSYGALSPVSGTNLLFIHGTTDAVTPTAPNAYLESDAFPVTGGLAYRVKFNSANPVTVGGANPQYRIGYYDAANAFISGTFTSIGASSSWTLISVTNTAPANAAFMRLFFIQAVGAGASWDWVTLLDDISVNAIATAGPTNELSPIVQTGTTFTATVQTNGLTAFDATGTVTFKTNAVQLSVNAVAGGSATSATATLAPPYTVMAIYSGDGTYLGSTNTLSVGGGVNTAPTNIVSSVSGNQLTLTWPADHIGWKLQAQTNALSAGLTTNWHDVTGSTATNQMSLTINPANPTVFFRLVYP